MQQDSEFFLNEMMLFDKILLAPLAVADVETCGPVEQFLQKKMPVFYCM